MRIYVFTDMEGASGISGSDFVNTEGRHYQAARRYYTWDMNACARGCFQAGADEVIVRDGHSDGSHVVWEELDQRVELVRGHGGDRRMPALDGADAVILLAYHAMAGTAGALLDHTFCSATIQNMWLNGREVGEIGIDAAIVGEKGIPTIMVSGDDKACAEARDWIPGVLTCPVKVGFGCQGARLLPMEAAHRLIEEKAAEAVRLIKSIRPLKVDRPVTVRIEKVERGSVPSLTGRPDIRVLDGRTYETTADTVEAAVFRVF